MDPRTVLDTLKSILSKNSERVSLHEPEFGGNEWAYVKECLDTGWVSSAGEFVNRFEQGLSEYVGVEYAVAAVNGTAALHLALMVIAVRPDEEVLMPSLTFVATANAVKYCGAIPHFVDCDKRTLGVDPGKTDDYLRAETRATSEGCFNKKTGRRIRALIAMHTFGHPVDLDPLAEVCGRHNLDLIEDAAESLGSFYKGRHTGNWGRLAVLSFNGNKIATTGGGGAVLTHDESLAALAKHLSTTARIPHKWGFDHDSVAYNYRLPNINAALGCAQLEQMPAFLRKKRALAEEYRKVFEQVEGVRFFSETDFAQSNYWLNVLLLDEENAALRDELLDLTNSNGIMTRPVWTPMHRLPMFRDCPSMDLSITENLEKRIVNIPSSAFLGGSYIET
ncbi:LegC family aminotransferase [Planctomycetota bacterium]